MADQVLTFTIPDAKVAVALEGFLKIYPNNETIPDPEWVKPDPNPDEKVAPQIAKYTNAQWVREKIRRNIVRDIKRGLQMKANQEAQIAEDNGIVA